MRVMAAVQYSSNVSVNNINNCTSDLKLVSSYTIANSAG